MNRRKSPGRGNQQVKVVGKRFDLRERGRAMTLTVSRCVVEVRTVSAPVTVTRTASAIVLRSGR